MTTARISQLHTTAARGQQAPIDVIARRAALALLAWSNRRAMSRAVSHERMGLLRQNARATEQRPMMSPLVH